MTVSVENDRASIDITDRELARIRAAVRQREGIANPTVADIRRALIGACAVFCSKGCRYPSKAGRNARRKTNADRR